MYLTPIVNALQSEAIATDRCRSILICEKDLSLLISKAGSASETAFQVASSMSAGGSFLVIDLRRDQRH